MSTKRPWKMRIRRDGLGSTDFTAEASAVTDGLNSEFRVSILRGLGRRDQRCVADVFIGVDTKGEPRVLITDNGDGDGDHRIAVFPLRHRTKAVENFG
jgi:hypothetical protein